MSLRVSLLDYGVGNIHSIHKALQNAGATVHVADPTPEALEAADAVVLPGVGAFGAAAHKLTPVRDALLDWVDAGRPLLGVCVGMQLLFDESVESPGARGLGVIPGRVERLNHAKLPQIGWNRLDTTDDPLFTGLTNDAHVYYVNSYAPHPENAEAVIATTPYGDAFPAVVRERNAYGTQFHPEKSSRTGLAIVENFVNHAEACQ